MDPKYHLHLETTDPSQFAAWVDALVTPPPGTGALLQWSDEAVSAAKHVLAGSKGMGYEGCAPAILDQFMDYPGLEMDMKAMADAVGAPNWQSVSSTLRLFKRLASEAGYVEPWENTAVGSRMRPGAVAAFKAARQQLDGVG